MAQITWRNVDAPDFRGVQQGIESAGNTINRGFQAAQAGLDRFDETKSDALNNNVLAQLLSIQNPDTAPEDIQAIIGNLAPSDIRRLDPNTFQQLNTKTSNLLDLDIKETTRDSGVFELGVAKREDDVLVKNRDTLKAMSGTFSNASQLASQGNKDAAFDLLTKDPNWNNLDIDAQTKIRNSVFGFAKDDQSFDQSNNDELRTAELHNQAKIVFGQNQEDRARAEQAVAFTQQINRRAITADDATAMLNQLADSGVDPMVLQFVRSNLGTGGSSVGGSSSGGGGAGRPNFDRIMNYEAKASGYAEVPSSVKTMGEARAFAKTVNRANRLRMGKNGSSAMGTYQITGDTMEEFAPKALGKDWRSKPYNAENQDKIAEAIFYARNGSAQSLKDTWVSLSLQEAEALRKQPWETARIPIAAKESGASAAQLLGVELPDVQASTGDSLGYEASFSEGANSPDGAESDLVKLASKKLQPQAAGNYAVNLLKKAGLKISVPQAVAGIQKIVNQSRYREGGKKNGRQITPITNAQAAYIYANSFIDPSVAGTELTTRDIILGGPGGIGNILRNKTIAAIDGTAPNKLSSNQKYISEQIAKAKRAGNQDVAYQGDNIKLGKKAIDDAEKAVAEAKAFADNYARQRQLGNGTEIGRQRAEARVAVAEEIYKRTIGANRSNVVTPKFKYLETPAGKKAVAKIRAKRKADRAKAFNPFLGESPSLLVRR